MPVALIKPATPCEHSLMARINQHFSGKKKPKAQKAKTAQRGKAVASTTVAVAVSSDEPPPTCPTLAVEHAKSGRAACRACEEKIAKGDLRFAVLCEAEPGSRYRGPVPRWYHKDCFIDGLENHPDVPLELIEAKWLTNITLLEPDEVKDIDDMFDEARKDKGLAKLPQNKRAKRAEDRAEVAATAALLSSEAENQAKLQAQSKAVWEVRDQLDANLTTADLVEFLDLNGLHTNGGRPKLLERAADAMYFGTLPACDICKETEWHYTREGYACHGDVDEWTKCNVVTQEPKFKKCKLTAAVKAIPVLGKTKWTAKQRIFPAPRPDTEVVAFTRKQPKVRLWKCCCQGSTQCLAFLANSLSALLAHCIFPCLTVTGFGFYQAKKAKSEASASTSKTLLVKGRCAVDDAVECGEAYTVVDDGKRSHLRRASRIHHPMVKERNSCLVDMSAGTVWNASMTLVDNKTGTNSFYKLQLLQHDASRAYYLFRAWGRVNTERGGSKLQSCHGLSQAKTAFQDLFQEKSGNVFGETPYQKVPNHFFPLDVQYAGTSGSKAGFGETSTLPKPVLELLRLIGDEKLMSNALLEMSIDTTKMPLGALSKRQLQEAYSVLTTISELLEADLSQSELELRLSSATNRFYTLVPHDFGEDRPPLIDSVVAIREKTALVETLIEMAVAMALLRGTDAETGASDPADALYARLHTKMQPLESSSDIHKMICKYIRNTHAATHRSYKLRVDEVFEIAREGEAERFQEKFSHVENRKLLWHGSRLTNFCGILSQGLRIAPPEAPVTGYMFNKGIYFADMCSKSANYCHASRNASTGLLLLAEVPLGESVVKTSADCNIRLPKGKDGRVTVPLGKATSADVSRTDLLYNEYIVYDESQVQLRYLVRCTFDF
ncbi:uncharacterized protein MONBRDRAFT_26401 [Monosiga brevicollis MX1]|uniref:Poly [ADP-ribose] polymerase n=1 Tax=Monosiga brevicollis TaxID=81824 RepID=A9V294_MONBE|nr:uncharacterized protein MONBRDRAFT_26401 [Monosiga brevicollis MX1]EDQ88218.1 predicted protein [Monosiga brevicollis MX1]|eukprot:XP_001746811.1 hypothetical protein [Monosiga brevicollis MX1]